MLWFVGNETDAERSIFLQYFVFGVPSVVSTES